MVYNYIRGFAFNLETQGTASGERVQVYPPVGYSGKLRAKIIICSAYDVIPWLAHHVKGPFT